MVCKITDRDGALLYINGSPAVYGTLEAGFEVYNAAGAYSFTDQNGSRATARRIEMLIGAYTLQAPVTLGRGKTVLLTTAPETDTDGYAYTGEPGSVCVITRGENCDTSMITNISNLTLMNITLDGGDRKVVGDGGIVNNAQTSAVLTIADKATLRNSKVDDKELRDLTSGINGVFWIGELNYGTYYLQETTVPGGYSSLAGSGDNWYILTVNENGVGYEQQDQTVSKKLNPEIIKPHGTP